MSWLITGAPGTGDNLLYSQAGTPSLDLRFASTKSLNDYVSGNNLITFTRASTGTFVGSNGLIQTAASNAPRFDHNPVTGESLGLLVEEARTNSLQYSEQFDNAYWTKDKTAVTPNAAIAPDGTLTADLLYTTTSGVALTYRGIGAVASSPYTNTIYLKSAGFTWAFVYGTQGNFFAHFNLIAGTVGTVGAGVTASISPAGNGWYRCSVTQTVTTRTFHVGPADANGSTASTASGTSGIYAWGAQVEAGSFPTSYIPTVASTGPRAADLVAITGTNFSSWYNSTAGTWFGQVSRAYATTQRLFEVGDSSSNQSSVSVRPGPTSTSFARQASGAGTVSHSYPAKFAVADSVADIQGCVNGTLAVLITTGTSVTDDKLVLGGEISGTSSANAIARLTYWPSRLANTTLQTITL